MKRLVFQALSAAILCLKISVFAQSPPANDDFENRIVLSGSSVTVTGTLAGATLQAEEPDYGLYQDLYGYPYVQYSSVWWSWTASMSGPATFYVLDFSTNTLKLGGIDAWVGTNLSYWDGGQITFVGGTGLDTGRHPFFTFSATAGITYQLRISGTNSGNFTLRITETNSPIILIQPVSRTVPVNGSICFGVAAAGVPLGSPRFTYQWRFNGMDLPGKTFQILSFDNLTTNNCGSYSVMVSNSVSGTISDAAILNVTETIVAPQLMPVGCTDGQFRFKILGELGRLYRIQSSTNLVDWSEERSFPNRFIYYGTTRPKTGVVYNSQDSFSVSQDSFQKFYRVIVYVAPNEICINNLRKIRLAYEMRTLESKSSGALGPDLRILTYFTPNSVETFCPLTSETIPTFASSYTLVSFNIDPLCTSPPAHRLEEPEF